MKLLVSLLFFTLFSPLAQGDAPKLQKTEFMSNLENPWDFAFLPNGSVLFTEKCKGLSIRRPDGSIHRLFGTSGSAVLAQDLFCEGQSGMQGLALDPKFPENRLVYVFMSSNLSKNPRTNRILQLALDANYTTVLKRTDIVRDIPYKDKRNNWGGPGSHSGGRLRFGPDGFLYITTGDNHNGTLPQDLKRLGGKVLRVDRNGKAAPGNKISGSRIFTYGHRNVQGISFHPISGQPYISEHGPGHSDEITALVNGGNGGWDPKPDPGVTCADNYCGYISNKLNGSPTSMTDLEKFPEAMRPAWTQNDSQGMGPCLFLQGSQWKDWNGNLVVGIMGAQRLDILRLDEKKQFKRVDSSSIVLERPRSLLQGPDGDLYMLTDNGKVWRLSPEP